LNQFNFQHPNSNTLTADTFAGYYNTTRVEILVSVSSQIHIPVACTSPILLSPIA